jgi:hypothetical protein
MYEKNDLSKRRLRLGGNQAPRNAAQAALRVGTLQKQK